MKFIAFCQKQGLEVRIGSFRKKTPYFTMSDTHNSIHRCPEMIAVRVLI